MHPTELTLAAHVDAPPPENACAVCGGPTGAAAYVATDAMHLALCRTCALAPLAARFRGDVKAASASPYEAEADVASAARCVAVDAAAHRLWLSEPVRFEGNRAAIEEDSRVLLDQLARVLLRHPTICVRFEGHTNSACGLDCDGTATCSNSRCARDFGASGGALAFSRRRAEAVRDWCVRAGVDDDRVTFVGLAGSRRLVEDTEGHNRNLNRRVEVHTI